MDFKDIINKIDDKNKLILGYEDDNFFSFDIEDYPSIIITGETGSGKSILLDQILCELISTHTSLEMGLMLIDTSGVELNQYHESRYSYFSAIKDERKSIVVLAKVIREIFRRKEIFEEKRVINFHDYNEQNPEHKLPLLVLAIDDNNSLIVDEDIRKMLVSIIKELNGLGILFILAESNTTNKFFRKDENELSSVQITFDYANAFQSDDVNMDGADELEIGEFLVKMNDEISKYHNFEFDDNCIKEIVEY